MRRFGPAAHRPYDCPAVKPESPDPGTSKLSELLVDVMTQSVDSILDRAIEGDRLGETEIQDLFDHGGLLELGQAADAVRRRKNPPDIATYIIDRNINYTNVCVYRCRFCAFYRGVTDADAYVLPFDQIAAKVSETVACGGTGILLQGGVHPNLHISYYESLLADLKKTFPQIHLHAFSVPEIWYLAKLERMPVRQVLERLIGAGLDSIPGGGAEILEDETRRRIWSRAKASTDQWLGVHRRGARARPRTTATMMFGVGEPSSARVAHLLGVRACRMKAADSRHSYPGPFRIPKPTSRARSSRRAATITCAPSRSRAWPSTTSITSRARG